MSVIKLYERLGRIEAAYLQALGDRLPEVALRPSVWRSEILPAILAAVPDCTIEEQIEMFHWRRRKFERQAREAERRGDEAMRALRERKW
jgi:hypothetical protein